VEDDELASTEHKCVWYVSSADVVTSTEDVTVTIACHRCDETKTVAFDTDLMVNMALIFDRKGLN